MSNWCCPSRRCLCCMIALRGTFTTKQQYRCAASALLPGTALCTIIWQNLDVDSFDMLYKNDCWGAIPDLIWTINLLYERKINMLSCTEISFVRFFFFFFLRNFESNRGFLLRNSIELILKTFDMCYKNCWTVICYPISVTNVSYEREIIVLLFPVISFVILNFSFFWDLKLNLSFIFFYSHCILG